jgi:hypothetical protein
LRDEPDHERAGDENGEYAGRREQTPISRRPTRRVITAEIGLAVTEVSVRASSNSTQNMKQKKAATPMPSRSAAP